VWPEYPSRAGPGQKKKTVQKVQAPAQPFIAFDPARPADDQSAHRACRVFSCLPRSTRLRGWASTLCLESIGKGRIRHVYFRVAYRDRCMAGVLYCKKAVFGVLYGTT